MSRCTTPLQLQAHLGSGSSGSVYRIGNDQVIKIQLFDTNSLAEAIFLSSIRHPNIITYYDACVLGNDLYLTLEEGDESYSQWVHRTDPSMAEKDQVLEEVQCAINFLHLNGLYHNDLHTENIVMVKGVGKLIDFGWASLVENPEDYLPWGEIEVGECVGGYVISRPVVRAEVDMPSLAVELNPEHYLLTRALVSKVSIPIDQGGLLFIACSEIIAAVYREFTVRAIEDERVIEVVDRLKRVVLSELEFQVL